MPLLRYFLFVGAGLFALLFVIDGWLPTLPAAESPESAVDLSIVRIHSDKKWPERIVFDTTRPATPPPPHLAAPVIAQALPVAKSGAAPPLNGQAREAFAQLRSNPNAFPNPEPKRKRRSVAKNYAGSPIILVAQQPHIGFFGVNIW